MGKDIKNINEIMNGIKKFIDNEKETREADKEEIYSNIEKILEDIKIKHFWNKVKVNGDWYNFDAST